MIDIANIVKPIKKSVIQLVTKKLTNDFDFSSRESFLNKMDGNMYKIELLGESGDDAMLYYIFVHLFNDNSIFEIYNEFMLRASARDKSEMLIILIERYLK